MSSGIDFGTSNRTEDAGHQVRILNPAIIHHYTKSRLSRAKTDPVDADVLADYAAKEHPPAWTLLPREMRDLQALVRRLDALLGMQTEERNRAQAGWLTPAVAAVDRGSLEAPRGPDRQVPSTDPRSIWISTRGCAPSATC